jgi:GT2 family glycosyltransferase
VSAGGSRDWGVVVVNWNTPMDTIACLESVRAAKNHPRHVVLVDNASTDGSVERIVEWARGRGIVPRVVPDDEDSGSSEAEPWLRVIASAAPRGFSANNNLGLRYFRDRTTASHVLLLNNDATVAPEFFQELSEAVARRPDGGLFTGTIYHDPERSRVWYAGGRINPLRALVTHQTELPARPDPRETTFVCGCAMLISRPVMQAVGLLPECFDPIYCEDADYSLRARSAGFALIYAPGALVYHKVGATVGKTSVSPRTTFSTNRNRAFLLRRNYHGWRLAAGLGYLLVTKPGRALLDAARGRPKVGWAVLTGMLAGLFGRGAHTASR